MKLNRKWLMVIALVMSLTMATAGTLAYLTDTDSATNTFTIGDVEIDLTERSWSEDDQPTLLPGVEIAKDPQIKNTGNTDAWVWMEIVIPSELYDIVELDYNTTDWTMGDVTTNADDDKVVLMKYSSKLASEATTPAAFTKVSIDSSVNELPNAHTADIVVNAYAIQAEKISSVDNAIRAYNGDEMVEEPNGDDDNVTYDIPDGAVTVSNAEELAAGITDGKTVFLLKKGTYNIPSACKGKTLTLVGEDLEGTILEIVPAGQGEANGQLDYNFDGSTVTFMNLTIKSNNNTYAGYTRLTGTYKNVNFENHYSLQRESHFEYCTLNVTGDQYNVWTWGAGEVTFDHCTFNCDGKAILVYNQSCDLTVSNCVFNDNGAISGKAAIEACNGDSGKNCVTHNIVVTNTDVNGFDVTGASGTQCDGTSYGTTLWGNKNLLDDDHLNVTVDGVVEY